MSDTEYTPRDQIGDDVWHHYRFHALTDNAGETWYVNVYHTSGFSATRNTIADELSEADAAKLADILNDYRPYLRLQTFM